MRDREGGDLEDIRTENYRIGTERLFIAKKGYLIPDYLAVCCKVSKDDKEHKVALQDEALTSRGNYPDCTVRSSIAGSKVACTVRNRHKEKQNNTKKKKNKDAPAGI